MYERFDTLTTKALAFYRGKNPRQSYTDLFMREYDRNAGDYNVFAQVILHNNGAKGDTEMFHVAAFIEDYLAKGKRRGIEIYSLRGLDIPDMSEGRDFIHRVGINSAYGEPNQKWHFLVAYCAYHEVLDILEEHEGKRVTRPSANMSRLKNLELWLWLIEAARDDKIITGLDVKAVYTEAVFCVQNGRSEFQKEFLNVYKDKLEQIIMCA